MIAQKETDGLKIFNILHAKCEAAERRFADAERARRQIDAEIAALESRLRSILLIEDENTDAVSALCAWRQKLLEDLKSLHNDKKRHVTECAQHRRLLEQLIRQKISVEALLKQRG